ncbi:Sigma 54 interacting domain protein [Desulfobulbus propionicus DSM 2032]|uniref:Sigma 54 interacting domain protein n=1 Tax=Desulfobulbus propionicus (strain ATCC 33891 / DSM 2032 / VKM B-1956 / 1pr3) TaxID=577650 RepID=A0A7U3YP50_DESPD|nr:sigma 54-interacting transcriptional regulator [Desulfobulbus propionicus]ADW18989.1 Sigma 54 interacting domain protein [Desulfobulbus propionicus DSM 2032]
MRYSHPPLLNPLIRVDGSIYSWSVGKFLVLLGTLLVVIILSATVIVTYHIVSSYLDQAYSRNAQVRALAQAHEINQLLVAARYELEYLTRLSLTPESISTHLAAKSAEERNRYREIAFHGQTAEERFVLVNTGSSVIPVPIDQAMGAKFGIFSSRDLLTGKPAGYIQIGEPMEVVYPSVHVEGKMSALNMHVIRLTTPVYDGSKTYKGQLTLSIDLPHLRDIISLHTSKQSPLFLFPQESEHKKSFFFDAAGWLLFQSESPDRQQADLSVDLLRMGLQGDVGRPGFSTAFRPGFAHDLYWAMVSDVQAGKSGQILVTRPFIAPSGSDRSLYLSYVPIVFEEGAGTRRIVGGIGCIDTSFVFMASTYRIAGTLSVCVALGVILVFMAMYFVSRRIARQLELLAEAVDVRAGGDDPSPLALGPLFAEINQFQRSINILLMQLHIARSDSLLREGLVEDDRMRQRVNLEKEMRDNPLLDARLLAMPLYGIVGGSQAVGTLRQQIHKASRVLADVLIVGETGTGKELTAEAIHSVSHRAKGPFISINCGALDENLLMDALFGHVKGAFSDAQNERKGAFVAASGGTLHLDEIGNASPKVQQALLRALSVRRIRPLGSDQDVAFDARIIAATNVDLLQLSLTSDFREDLYYRLAVITINTPPLRERKEDIPVLVKYFLDEHMTLSGLDPVGISRGALERLLSHDWPGNIRELRNCITRSLAFAESDLLLAQHILFDERGVELEGDDAPENESFPSALPPTPPAKALSAPPANEAEAEQQDMGVPPELNIRQRKAWPLIVKNGVISRSEYQKVVGDAVSVRTAQYDLHDLVDKGLMKKSGRGPSSKYLLATSSPH